MRLTASGVHYTLSIATVFKIHTFQTLMVSASGYGVDSCDRVAGAPPPRAMRSTWSAIA